MKRIRSISILIVVAVMSIIGVTTIAAQAQRYQQLISDPKAETAAPSAGSLVTTTFTYQGLIKQSGSPINGNCDLAFGLFDAPSGGSPIGSAITRTLSIANGLFTVGLNFGDGSVFAAEARWLEIQVRCPAGGGGFTTLNARQSLSPMPYALALPGLYTTPNITSPNVIGGYSGNSVFPGVVGATIAGGGYAGWANVITASYASIGGGDRNMASNIDVTIGGGNLNAASGFAATIGGGNNNHATGDYATVSGGTTHSASGIAATVGGGSDNNASGYLATIPGGRFNSATMSTTLAAGYRAKANHAGTFVWADSTEADFVSTANDQFLIRANGRVGINTNNPTADLTISSSKSISSSFTGIDIYNSSSPAGLTGWRMQVVGSDTPSRVGNFELYYTSPFLVVQPGGNVGVGTTTINDKLQVNGDIRVGTSGTNGCVKGFGGAALTGSCSSDVRLKTNITPFPNMLDKVTALQPVYYNWRADQYPDYHFDGSTRSYGVIAQDVEKVLPELVGTDDRGFKTVNYSEIPVLLLQALKDLRVEKDTQIAAQQRQIDDLQSRLSNMEQNTTVSNPPAQSEPFNVFNLISVIALIGFVAMWLQQRTKRGGYR